MVTVGQESRRTGPNRRRCYTHEGVVPNARGIPSHNLPLGIQATQRHGRGLLIHPLTFVYCQ